MMELYLVVPFAVFLALGMPIAFCLGIGAAFFVVASDRIPLTLLPQQIYTAVDSFPLMAVPFFLFAGSLMNRTGITQRLIEFSRYLIGWMSGGLAQVNIIASMFFAGISGSALADTAALGSILIPAMKEEGYEADFSAAVTVASSVIGPIIPPSIPAVLVGTSLAISIGGLFAAGMVPGILLGLSLMVVTYIYSRKRNYRPTLKEFSFVKLLVASKDAVLALIMPLIILGGILSGVFTATEAGAVAAAYELIIGFWVYRTLTFKKLYHGICETCITTAVIMFIVGTSNPFGWILGVQLIPQKVASGLMSVSTNPIVVLSMINVFLLVAGMFLESTTNILILGPILYPIMQKMGIHPFHFGAILILNVVIGLITPPLGLCLYIAAPIAKIRFEKIVRSVVFFLVAELIVLILVTYVPAITLYMPRIFGFM